VAEKKPVLAVALDYHLPCVTMNEASARRCVGSGSAVADLQRLPGFQVLTNAWQERERALLSSRSTTGPETLAGYRRKARAYRLVRVAIEQAMANKETAEKHQTGTAPAAQMPMAGTQELAALMDALAMMTGEPTLKDLKDAQYDHGQAERMVENAQAASEAIQHPGWRVIMAFLAGLAWAHWLMLGEGVGDDAEHQDTIGVIAAMIQNAQNVLLQGREAEQWFRSKAGETA